MSELLKLERFGSNPYGTFGRLEVPGGKVFATLEPQWRDNAAKGSCIPAGRYPLLLRASPIVNRLTKGKYPRGWEVDQVPGRDLIMFHPGNWQKNSEGCILVGRSHQEIGGVPGVSASQAAFADFMQRLQTHVDYEIDIWWRRFW